MNKHLHPLIVPGAGLLSAPCSRRDLMGGLARIGGAGLCAGALGAGMLGAAALPGAALALEHRVLDIKIVGFTLGIHIPAVYALRHGVSELPGYGPSNVVRQDRLAVITQSILSGQGDIADGDVVTTLKAAEAGADIRIIGLTYNNTSQVYVANTDSVRSLEDLVKPGVTVAVNSVGDFMHVMLMGPLIKRGIDPVRLTVLEIGGSGNRMRALMAGRIGAVPVHFDQAQELVKRGNYTILVEPWKEYTAWYGQVLFTTERWLSAPANRRAAVDVLKAVLTAYRRANRDLDWFAEQYRQHATIASAKTATSDGLRDIWSTLSQTIHAWPENMETFTPARFAELMPFYKSAGALNGSVDLEKVIDRSCLDQALHELG